MAMARRDGAVIVVSAVFLLSTHAFSLPPQPGDCDSTGSGSVVVADGRRALAAIGTVLTSPLRWETTDWYRCGGTGVAVLGLSLADTPLRNAMQRSQGPANDRAADIAIWFGDGGVVLGVSAGGYVAGAAFHDRWLRETSLMIGTAVLTSGAVSTVLKVVVGRARPYAGVGPGTFRPFKFTDAYASFPSGHSVVGFALATVLSRRIDNPWASVLLYGIAGSVALSRMYLDEHWLSDVAFGGALSYFVGNSVVDILEGRPQCSDARVCIIPHVNGVTVAFVW
jgi:hypothetical protein